MIFRQLGGFIVGTFIFFAFIAAMSRLLTVKELPGYITNMSKGIANLFNGAFGK